MKAIWMRLVEEKMESVDGHAGTFMPRPGVRVKVCLGGGDFQPQELAAPDGDLLFRTGRHDFLVVEVLRTGTTGAGSYEYRYEHFIPWDKIAAVMFQTK